MKLRNLKRGWRIRLTPFGNEYVLKAYSPIFAQDNLLGKFGDKNSCFRNDGCNSHHPSLLARNGWQFLAIYKNGKEHSRCWIKICKRSVLVTNIYTVSGKVKNFDLVLSKLFGEYTTINQSCIDGVYTNGGSYRYYHR